MSNNSLNVFRNRSYKTEKCAIIEVKEKMNKQVKRHRVNLSFLKMCIDLASQPFQPWLFVEAYDLYFCHSIIPSRLILDLSQKRLAERHPVCGIASCYYGAGSSSIVTKTK